jgi:hypothetical protein
MLEKSDAPQVAVVPESPGNGEDTVWAQVGIFRSFVNACS